MTIVEGQIEPLKKLKETLRKSGITRFSSIGDINRFLENYDTEKKELPNQIEKDFDSVTEEKQSSLANQKTNFEQLIFDTRNDIKREIEELHSKIETLINKRKKSFFSKPFLSLKITSLTRERNYLEIDFDLVLKKRISKKKIPINELENEINHRIKNREQLISETYNNSLKELTHTKEVVEDLYTLIAGAIGENSVVKTLEQLSDDYYLINDYSLEFDPPIYNRKENDRIFSIQIDHLLISQSGVFLIETKNWSKESVKNFDLRSPVKQVLRTSFALFVLLNSDSKHTNLRLERHHWGAKKIPIRNIIAMSNEKPKADFKHVKVVSTHELVGYIQYFENVFSKQETKKIFEYLKKPS